MKVADWLSAGLAAAFVLSGQVTGHAIAATFTQDPCVSSEHAGCVRFGATGDIPTIRTMALPLPAGKAKLTFHGTLYCAKSGSSPGRVELVSQIVAGDGLPTDSGPSGLRHAVLLETGKTSQTFNLHSTRVFRSPEGNNVFNFMIARRSMSASVECIVYNATFTMQYLPEGDSAVIVTQAPCKQTASAKAPACASFSMKSDAAVPTIRTMTFTAPSDGTIQVSFHGSLRCRNTDTKRSLIVLQQQIVVGTKGVADGRRRGGNTTMLVLPKGNPKRFASNNLAATRTFDVKKGKTTVSFVITRGDFGAEDWPHVSAACRVYGAALTVHFVPSSSTTAMIVSQDPCLKNPDWCRQYPAANLITKPARSITFNAPGVGIAVVTLNAGFGCGTGSNSKVTAVDFFAQIRADTAEADVNGPGGARMADVLANPRVTNGDVGISSLAATAVFRVFNAGPQRYNLIIRRLRQDNDSLCFVANGTFTVNFTADVPPAPGHYAPQEG